MENEWIAPSDLISDRWFISLEGTDYERASRISKLALDLGMTGSSSVTSPDDFVPIVLDQDQARALLRVFEATVAFLTDWDPYDKQGAWILVEDWLAEVESTTPLKKSREFYGEQLPRMGFPQVSAKTGIPTYEIEKGTLTLDAVLETLEEAEALLQLALDEGAATRGTIINPQIIYFCAFDWCSAVDFLELLRTSTADPTDLELLAPMRERMELWTQAPHRMRTDCDEI